MKNVNVFRFKLLIIFIALNSFTIAQTSSDLSLDDLIGTWKLDMTPENDADSNFALMEITKIDKYTVQGTFYRKGVKIREGRVNTQRGIIYVALVSGDGTGDYNTSFYYKDGKLYGSTHSLERDFLAVWVATKEK